MAGEIIMRITFEISNESRIENNTRTVRTKKIFWI